MWWGKGGGVGGPLHSYLRAPACGDPRAGEEECRESHAFTATTTSIVSCACMCLNPYLAQAILCLASFAFTSDSPDKYIINLSW